MSRQQDCQKSLGMSRSYADSVQSLLFVNILKKEVFVDIRTQLDTQKLPSVKVEDKQGDSRESPLHVCFSPCPSPNLPPSVEESWIITVPETLLLVGGSLLCIFSLFKEIAR